MMGSMDYLAHKMLHTFEKMGPIHPTFEVTSGVVGEFDWFCPLDRHLGIGV